MKIALLAALALLAFAANSLLCRLALIDGAIDAASFTGVRLTSGALVLIALAWPGHGRFVVHGGSWSGALALMAYAAPFSYAYRALGAATGALLLFGAVQLTMIVAAIARGERPGPLAWLGMAMALAGLIGLTAPGVSAPTPWAAAAMAAAGVAWGVYSLRGRASAAAPLVTTAGNFLRAVPVALILVAVDGRHGTARGIGLAVASGALASGLGYTIWYAALRGLTATRAAILQLLVPVLAGAGAIALLGEPATLRLATAGAAILTGVLLGSRDTLRAQDPTQLIDRDPQT